MCFLSGMHGAERRGVGSTYWMIPFIEMSGIDGSTETECGLPGARADVAVGGAKWQRFLFGGMKYSKIERGNGGTTL